MAIYACDIYIYAIILIAALCFQGGCGYGVLDKKVYPYWSVAALSTSNKYYKAGPDNGCGYGYCTKCLSTFCASMAMAA